MVTDPVLSVAVISTTGAVLASLICGEPENVLVALLRLSHVGALDNEYVIGKVDVNVEAEKVKLKGVDTLATGGTCELIGNVIDGVASIRTALINAYSKTKVDMAMALITDSIHMRIRHWPTQRRPEANYD